MKLWVRDATCFRPFWVLALLVATALAFGSGPVRAQGTPPAGDRATALFDEGNELYHQSKWEQAAAKFAESFELRQAFDTAANLGDCELRLGRARAAAEHISYALKHFPATGKERAREQLNQWLSQAKARVGSLTIAIDPPGATVSVDGKAVGTSPIDHELFVEPGQRTLAANKAGYQPAEKVLDVKAGTSQQLTLELVAAEENGDGTGEPIDRGRSDREELMWSAIGATGVAVVFFIAGAVLRVKGASQKEDAKVREEELAQAGTTGWVEEVDEMYGEADKNLNGSTGVLIGGGVFGAAALAMGIWYLVTAPDTESTDQPEDPAIKPQVVAGPHGASVGLSVSF